MPPELIGCLYSKARRSFDRAVICGYVRDGRVQMLPDEEAVMLAGSCMVLDLYIHICFSDP